VTNPVESLGARGSMTAVETAVRVLVVGPPDLVTTSVVPALRAHGIAAGAHRAGDPLPTAPGGGSVAVVNLDVPDGPGVVAAAASAGWRPIAVFRPSDPERGAAAVAAGASALVARTASFPELLHALAAVADGGAGMSAEERAYWLGVHRATLAEIGTRRRRLDMLTEREFEVLKRLERGQKAADIAVDAVVAMSTVRTHIRSILVKLEVTSQQQAVALYRETRRRGDWRTAASSDAASSRASSASVQLAT
jgi:DNA-binding NarL/FixJ family response regulator